MAWLKLLRIPLLPSALTNILVGFLIANGTWQPALELVFLLLASACLYSAGMVLNDVYDVDIDREERPNRPLPSGAIDVRRAQLVGMMLLGTGVGFATGAGWVGETAGLPFGLPTLIAITLATCIWLYDAILKKTLLAPWLMGGCRGLNILLGASTATFQGDGSSFVGIPFLAIWIASAIATLIAGVTLLARHEAKQNRPEKLIPAALVMLVGIITLAAVPHLPEVAVGSRLAFLFPCLIAMLSFTFLRRTLLAIQTGKPQDIQKAVVATLRSLILFDAACCYLVRPESVVYSVTVVCFLIPGLLLGRRIAST